MARRPWKGVVGVGFPPAPVALSPEARQDDILLDGAGTPGDADATGLLDFQERPYVILPDKGSDARGIATSTHAVDIFAFVDAQEIPFRCFHTPHFLSPAPGGEKVYALLRETLRRSRKIGIAYVVIQMRRQLAALVPQGQSLVLSTLRCENEVDAQPVPPAWFDEVDDASLSEAELAFARQLVDSMTEQWDVLLQTNHLRHGIEALENFDTSQPIRFDPPQVADLEELVGWVEAQDDGYDDGFLELPSRPHRYAHMPASRRSGVARASGQRMFGARVRRMN